MKKIAAGSFKVHCLAIMDEVQAKREAVIITKHGKPVAKLVPVNKDMDEIYNFLFVGPLIRFSVFLWRIFDDLLVDGTVNGVAAIVRGGSQVFRRLQTGNVQSYALSILVGVVLIIGYFVFNIK